MTESGFKKVVALTSALSLAAAAWIILRVYVFPDTRPKPLAQQTATPTEASPAPKPPVPTEWTRTILSNDLFGLKPTAGTADRPKEPPKQAEIDMELAGTVVSTDARRSVAFMRDKSSKAQKPYAVGAAVKDAHIKSIGKNFVILERQGREEILSMKP